MSAASERGPDGEDDPLSGVADLEERTAAPERTSSVVSKPTVQSSLRTASQHDGDVPADDAVAAAEVLISQGQWARVAELLGPAERALQSEPRVAFLYAMAVRECAPAGAESADGDGVLEQSLGGMLGVPVKSPLVRILARRLYRRSWRATPAPPARTSVLLVLASITVGSFVGFLLGPGRDWFKNM